MKNRGFTLIEVSTVIVVMAMMAALVAPNVASAIEGGKRRGFRVSVLTLIRQAKNESIVRGATTDIRSSESTVSLVLPGEDSETTLGTVNAVNGVELSHFQQDGNEVSEGEWAISFYPDGTSSGGGFQFDEGQGSQAVIVSKKTGLTRLTKVDSTTVTDDETEWEAGDFVQKSN